MSSPTNPLRAGARQPSSLVWNIAHRGARAFAPENTLPAFEKAVRLGCGMFELDVHMSADGQLIVHHDDQLVRCTDAAERFPGRDSYFVSDFTFEQLCRLDAGSWYVRQLDLPPHARQAFLRSLSDRELEEHVSLEERSWYASGEIRLPTLQQVLELAAQHAVLVNVELKTLPRMYPGLAARVVQLLQALDCERQVLVSSFDHEQLVEVRQRSPIVATGVLTADRLARPADYLALLDADAYHPSCCGEIDSLGFHSASGEIDSRPIESLRRAGRGVHVWTCNAPDQMRRLIAAGVSGVITDYPNRLGEVLAESPGGQSSR